MSKVCLICHIFAHVSIYNCEWLRGLFTTRPFKKSASELFRRKGELGREEGRRGKERVRQERVLKAGKGRGKEKR